MAAVNNQPAVSTHVEESAIIHAPVVAVWAAVAPLRFDWLPTVQASQEGGGNNPAGVGGITLGSTHTLTFKDGTEWTVQIMEASLIHNSISFEVVGSEPAASFSSSVHTIACRRVTATNHTLISWTTDYSNDVTADVVLDSAYKKKEAFSALAVRACVRAGVFI